MSLSRLACVALAATISALPGCIPKGGRTTLTIWHAWGGAELKTLKSLAKEFQAKQPEVEVLALQIPHDRLLDKFMRSAAANGGADLLIGDNDWSGKLAESDLLAPIVDFAEPDQGLFPPSVTSRFEEATIGALRVGKRLYAWPESVETVVLYHNRKLLLKAPKTAAGMREAALAAKPAEGYGLVFNTSFYFFAGFFMGGGGSVFDKDQLLALDTMSGRRMLGWLSALSKAPGVLVTNDYGKADSLYKQGKAAMIVNGPWALSDYQQALGPNLGVATLPKLENGAPAAPWIGVKCVMLNANSDPLHRKLAKDFLTFLGDPASQLKLAIGCGHIPAVKGIDLPDDSPLRVFQAQVRTGTPKSADPHLALVWDPMDRAIQEVLGHAVDPSVALERAQKSAEAKLAAVKANR